ncbi:MAG: fused protease/ribonucleoside-triphosphate reductase [Nanoarchaeota archaeon]|nr:fused protease/ribonucleoside-triphosphate reductase [Nanoarchaeota archaeon]
MAEQEQVGRGWDWQGEIETNQYLSPVQKRIIERLHDPSYQRFGLDDAFVDRYQKDKPPFGFNGFGELVYMRTYSRIKDDGSNERWGDTVQRIVEGTYNLQKRWIQDRGLEWSDHVAQESAQEMYDRIFKMKFTPPGRGIWSMGAPATEERGLYSALNNCAFVSTDNLREDLSKPFKFLMDMSMLGVGVGFDTKGAGQVVVKGPDMRRDYDKFTIPDTREGWVESVGRQIESYFLGINPVKFDYSNLRDQGEVIQGFGGKSSGPEPLVKLHQGIEGVLGRETGRPISSKAIVDLQNIIGVCVVAGNVRRTAEIALGEPGDEEFLDLKNYERNPERQNYGWTSNNSVFGELGMDYGKIASRIKDNGEPGLIWLDNIRKFGRMGDPPNNKDHRAKGVNPCVEQSLESYELCNLVETFPQNNNDLADYLRTLKFAYMYAKTVTLGETHWSETNRVLLRNRRIGCSVSGVAQFVAEHGLGEMKNWLRQGYDTIQHYDEVYSDWMTIPKSIKTTSVKPSGSVSSVAGATSGMHFPHSEYYIRRMRLSKQSELLTPLREAGHTLEDDVYDDSSLVVSFPVHVGSGVRGEGEVSMWEQFEVASFLQEHWADNQVSSTIKFQPGLKVDRTNSIDEVAELDSLRNNSNPSRDDLTRRTELERKDAMSEADQIEPALDYFQYRLKGISMLPNEPGVYAQAPYEEITREEYLERASKIRPVDFSRVAGEKAEVDKFCSNDVCEVKAETAALVDGTVTEAIPEVNQS